jgi:acyl-CoA synthetase (NDP forming)
MGATREAPTEAERIALARMEERLEAVMKEMNDLIFGPVADFRRAVEVADLELVPPFEPLRWGGSGG